MCQTSFTSLAKCEGKLFSENSVPHPIYSSVHGRNEYQECMNTTHWGKKQEVCEIGVIEVTNAVIYPRAMVVHLHYTSDV